MCIGGAESPPTVSGAARGGSAGAWTEVAVADVVLGVPAQAVRIDTKAAAQARTRVGRAGNAIAISIKVSRRGGGV
ncbi:hypothetical protein GCM10010975_15840 [Comamonas phosphati]|nr:hypothetical protein GCM10010975_15840 [Comamonas phosphati]